jgi:hypothetical protein
MDLVKASDEALGQSYRRQSMDGNSEGLLRRKKMNTRRDRIAMQGPARELVRHFLNVPVAQRNEYYLVQANTKYGPREIEHLARRLGIEER